MPTKKLKDNNIKAKILSYYMDGLNQKEILDRLQGELPVKKLKAKIEESEYLSPKNIRLGSILLFVLTLLSPVLTVYLRGPEYRFIMTPMVIISTVFASPFLVLGLILKYTRDLRAFSTISLLLMFYTVFYIVVFILISIDVDIWSLSLFPIILFPTIVGEYLKLQKLKAAFAEK